MSYATRTRYKYIAVIFIVLIVGGIGIYLLTQGVPGYYDAGADDLHSWQFSIVGYDANDNPIQVGSQFSIYQGTTKVSYFKITITWHIGGPPDVDYTTARMDITMKAQIWEFTNPDMPQEMDIAIPFWTIHTVADMSVDQDGTYSFDYQASDLDAKMDTAGIQFTTYKLQIRAEWQVSVSYESETLTSNLIAKAAETYILYDQDNITMTGDITLGTP